MPQKKKFTVRDAENMIVEKQKKNIKSMTSLEIRDVKQCKLMNEGLILN